MDRIVPDVLRIARERRRVTTRAMASALGVEQKRVAEIESLASPALTEDDIAGYAAALGTTPAEMLAEYDAVCASSLAEGRQDGDPPVEVFEPPGSEREAQMRRLWVTCGGVAVNVARVVRHRDGRPLTPQRIRQVAMEYGLKCEGRGGRAKGK